MQPYLCGKSSRPVGLPCPPISFDDTGMTGLMAEVRFQAKERRIPSRFGFRAAMNHVPACRTISGAATGEVPTKQRSSSIPKG